LGYSFWSGGKVESEMFCMASAAIRGNCYVRAGAVRADTR
jgi:hypothetical protein